MDVFAVIPARYDSSRFPGKVLANQTGKFLIQHTYEQALKARSVKGVLVATDSEKVMEACLSFGAPCVMTSALHNSGTDRIAEAVQNLAADIIVNLQGDEPEIDPSYIDSVARLLVENPEAQMGTLVAAFKDAASVADPNAVKAVVDNNGRAIYFSRSPIPFDRDAGGVGAGEYLRHLGIYAYRKDFLLRITKLPAGRLESIEKLEQLRVLENGYSILTAKVEHTWEGIDTRQQYEKFVARYGQRS